MFLMRKKLGIEQNVSESEHENFKRIDPCETEKIKVTSSPNEKL